MAKSRKKPLSPVLVFGAGSWGTALAQLIASNGITVRLWSHRVSSVESLQKHRENTQYLPGFPLSENIEYYHDMGEALRGAPEILLVVPSHAIEGILKQIQLITTPDRICWATKGVEASTKELISCRVQHYFPGSDMAMLSGPSFAKEVMQEMPTAVSISSNSLDYADDFAEYCRTDFFRVYSNEDLIATQIAGAVKNVLAIACGIADGLGLGANTRAAVITRGLAEMKRLGVKMGAKEASFAGLAGVGDLVLTCTDDLSRNRRFGLLLGAEKSISDALQEIGQVVEGMHNAEQVVAIADSMGVEMPICREVAYIIRGEKLPRDAVQDLLSRAPAIE